MEIIRDIEFILEKVWGDVVIVEILRLGNNLVFVQNIQVRLKMFL